jgi:hypothetical protein
MGWRFDPPAQTPARQPAASQESGADLVVTVEHVGGKVETFKDEVVRMELVLNSAGRLEQVHLITKSAAEADTHCWYNMDNLVCLRYQVLAITGKGKVSVRTIAPPAVKPPAETVKKDVVPLDPEDYR